MFPGIEQTPHVMSLTELAISFVLGMGGGAGVLYFLREFLSDHESREDFIAREQRFNRRMGRDPNHGLWTNKP